MTTCPNCPTLQAQIAQLQATNAMLIRIISAARGECVTLATEADQTMSGHVARGVWAHATGQGQAAQRILKRLES